MSASSVDNRDLTTRSSHGHDHGNIPRLFPSIPNSWADAYLYICPVRGSGDDLSASISGYV